MRDELDNKLVNKYPKIFRDRHADMRTTCICWGMETGDGWYWLIDNLCDSIQSYIDNNSSKIRIKNKYARFFIKLFWKINRKSRNKSIIGKIFNYKFIQKIEDRFEKEKYETIPQFVATQVKEKFGSLRFYYDGGNNLIDGMVWLAEHMSYNICENCGSIKNIGKTKSWIITLCEDCSKLDKYNNVKWEMNKNG